MLRNRRVRSTATLLTGTLLVAFRASGAEPDIPFGATIRDLSRQSIKVRPTETRYEYELLFQDQKPQDRLEALITPTYGMCEMRWTITVDPISPSGAELKKIYLDYYNRTNDAIGHPEYQDAPDQEIKGDSLWRSVYLEQRSVSSAWEKAKNREGDPTTLRLEASSKNAGSAIVRFTVSAPYIGSCLDEQKNAPLKE